MRAILMVSLPAAYALAATEEAHKAVAPAEAAVAVMRNARRFCPESDGRWLISVPAEVKRLQPHDRQLNLKRRPRKPFVPDNLRYAC